ncbi:ribonuclease E [Desulfonauticus submarinus]|uniref:Ribonuclease G n=1 Tax=Desulfonauticus submarinus TaxID=206665 RepID=A0A1H0B8Q1_9BACT|nr:Rne/Rng family ribonuclease [Desulfonauticus submarinus]SDN41962.1 ribonuclease E [Desulfonauticus submarinus]
MKKKVDSKRKMFISYLPEEEVEVAITKNGILEEYYVEVISQAKTKGNIYKGKIHNIDASLQAAFVNYGAEKNGFLQVDEVHPEYYQKDIKPLPRQKYPPLHRVLRPGQEILVQVVKEPTGSKGAYLTTYLSLPGRYLVLTPGSEDIGISRKIDDPKERTRLKKIVESMELEDGLGIIVRTVSEGQTKASLVRDLNFLKRLWKDIKHKARTQKAPCLVYEEKDLIFRAVRDYLTQDIEEVWVDHELVAVRLEEYIALMFPRKKNLVRLHISKGGLGLFERFDLDEQIEQIYSREIHLPSGARIVFDYTEALTAIDINSGKISGEKNFKEMAYKANLEAAQIIPLQLRLRDIGGQVVVDFIEMKDKKYIREVEKTLKNGLKQDRARTDFIPISRFGLAQIIRQRLGTSAFASSLEMCPCCQGRGILPSLEWQAQLSLKKIYATLRHSEEKKSQYVFDFPSTLALYLLNNKKRNILKLEDKFKTQIIIEEKKV